MTMNPIQLLRGFRGHPSHPPMTDAAIGAYTVTALALIAALLGFEQDVMTRSAIVALVVGLAASVPAIATGVADWVQISKGTPLRSSATFHGLVMTTATALFAIAGWLLRPAYDSGEASTAAIAMALIAYAVLAIGGWIGGSVVFVYGMRVLGEPETPTRQALSPHVEDENAGDSRPAA